MAMGNYEVRDPEAEKVLKDIGEKLRDVMPEGYGFTFLMYSFGEGGNMFYISNAMREDMIKSMKEFIEKQENNEPKTPIGAL